LRDLCNDLDGFEGLIDGIENCGDDGVFGVVAVAVVY